MSAWNDPELKELFFAETPLIDVRAPVEFAEGSLPFSVNLPLMNDEERHLVGIRYKKKGQAEAIKLGHELVCGEVKQKRILAWVDYINKHPSAQVFCFRGGLRSQTSCQWIQEAGISRTPIKGGYKRMRNFFYSYLEEAPLPEVFRLGGMTGSGKTQVLQKLPRDIFVDLEKLAHHRGSAFGGLGSQPTQITFENQLSLELMRKGPTLVVEDESAMIGRIALPRRFYHHMRSSSLVILKTTEVERIQNIFNEYVLPADYEQLATPLKRIANKLGGVRFKEVSEKLKIAFEKEKTLQNHTGWIEALLNYYYDPHYQYDLERQPGEIIYEGSATEVVAFLKDKLSSK